MNATVRNDSDIKKDILEELKWSPDVTETEIGVIVKKGAVTLTGTVPGYLEKQAAVAAAKRIRGVHAIADEIEVKFSTLLGEDDEDIAQHIASIFEWNSQIPGDSIKADVRNGVVTLSGDVDWQYQKSYVQRQVEGIKGVKFVTNEIRLRKRAAFDDVKREIVRALHRHAGLEASHVNVSVSDGTVTLTGNVNTYFDMDLVENAAWAAPGVTKVIDNMKVA